jgi:allantoate deiminase
MSASLSDEAAATPGGGPGSARLTSERLDALGQLTEADGEITRGYGTDSLVGSLELVERWMLEAGMTVTRDSVGSLVGRIGPTDAPTLLLGSHVDSVRNAGRFDGPLGVLASLAAIERARSSLDEGAVGIALIAFADEEGLRYRSSYLASRAFVGLFEPAELDITDDDGVPLAQAIRATGGDPAATSSPSMSFGNVAGYVEVHIEQGPVLQAEDLPVGVVTAIAGQSRGFVDFIGSAGHAGNTPHHLRRDALLAAAEFTLAVDDAMQETPGLVATVGRIENAPNVGNVIPGKTTVSYDVRHQEDDVKERAVDALRARAREIVERRGIDLDWRHLQDHPAVPMAARWRRALLEAVEGADIRPFELPSGAGHDAVSLAHVTDVGMLFCRCRDGVSHHPDEFVEYGDIAAVIDVLEQLVLNAGSEDAR